MDVVQKARAAAEQTSGATSGHRAAAHTARGEGDCRQEARHGSGFWNAPPATASDGGTCARTCATTGYSNRWTARNPVALTQPQTARQKRRRRLHHPQPRRRLLQPEADLISADQGAPKNFRRSSVRPEMKREFCQLDTLTIPAHAYRVLFQYPEATGVARQGWLLLCRDFFHLHLEISRQ